MSLDMLHEARVEDSAFGKITPVLLGGSKLA